MPMSFSAPFWSMMVRLSTLLETWKATRAGMLALISPVTTSTDGRWVARMMWMPTPRDFWARRVMASSISLPASIIRSANSSMMITR